MPVEVNWKELGLEPPEGEKKKAERPPEQPEKSVADQKKEIAGAMKSLERKYPHDITFDPSTEMAMLSNQYQGRVAELQQERAEALAEDPQEHTMYDTPERMKQLHQARLESLTGPLDQDIARLSGEKAWYDAAVDDMKKGDMRAATAFVDGKERDYAAKLGPAAKLEKQWEDYVKEMGKAGDIDKLKEALSGHEQAKAAADRIRGNLERVADQRRLLELKGERAAIDKKEAGPKKPADAATFDELKEAIAALPELKTADGRKLDPKEIAAMVDHVRNGVAPSYLPRAEGIRDKVIELMKKEGKG